MASSNANQEQQLMNGGEDEDPYKSEGHIELKIENLSGFAQEPIDSRRLSAPVYVRGVPWKILAIRRELTVSSVRQPTPSGRQRPRCLGYFLQCHNGTDRFWSYTATAQMKVLTQREDSTDCVHQINHVFNAKEEDWGFPQFMTFEHIMDPNNGWYDKQSDSITLAVDLTAIESTGFSSRDYVLIAQNELKLDKVSLNFSMQIGHLEWKINFDFDNRGSWKKLVVLSCKDVAKGRVDKVALELIGFHRDDPKSDREQYSPLPEKPVRRHLFTRADNSLTVNIPGGRAFNNLLFTVRVFKERSQFPDFTKPTAMVGRITANMTLRVGDQQFHVNRQFLSLLSPMFDRMLNGVYPEATQQEVELSLITHSAELFHQFLLVMCINETLPNSMNVAALFKLADFYDAENVHKKCDQHLRMAREMPIEKRVLLARKHCGEETQALIADSISLEQSERINLLLMQNLSI